MVSQSVAGLPFGYGPVTCCGSRPLVVVGGEVPTDILLGLFFSLEHIACHEQVEQVLVQLTALHLV